MVHAVNVDQLHRGRKGPNCQLDISEMCLIIYIMLN